MLELHGDVLQVKCPFCAENVDLFVDPETSGTFVEDCAVCCRPWVISVHEGHDGTRFAEVSAG